MCGVETKETLLYKSAGLIGGYVAGMEDVKGGITQKDIDRVRKMTRVGSTIRIRTCKGISLKSNGGGMTGVVRKVKVVSTSNKRFCTVMLPSGVTEQVLWSDLVKK